MPKQKVLGKDVPAGAVQIPAPPKSQGSGLGLILLIGGLLFLLVIIGAGIVLIATLSEEDPGISYGGSSPQGLENPGNYGQNVDLSGSPASGYETNTGSALPVTAKPEVSQPVQSGGSTSPAELILGTWEIQSTQLQMRFDPGGVATLRNPATGEYATGSWVKIADGRYRLRSPSGQESPLMLSDPLAGTMYFEDFSMIFIRKG